MSAVGRNNLRSVPATLIQRIETARCDLKYSEGTWHFALGEMTAYEGVFVRITDDAGRVGMGYVGQFNPNGDPIFAIEGAIGLLLAPSMLGKSVFPLWSHIANWEKALYRNRRAKCALELALLDLAGKILSVPSSFFLGGNGGTSSVDVVRILQLEDPERMACAAKKLTAEGYRYLKIKANSDVRLNIRRVDAIRNAVPDATRFIVDANQSLPPKDAIRVGQALEQLGVDIFEQPVHRDDVEGLRTVRQALSISVEADEGVAVPADVVRFHKAGAIDSVSIKIQKMGGLLASVAVAKTCDACGISYRMGANFGSRLLAFANMQFIHSNSVGYACEVAESDHLLGDPVPQELLQVKDGRVKVPLGVGLGIDFEGEGLAWHPVGGKD